MGYGVEISPSQGLQECWLQGREEVVPKIAACRALKKTLRDMQATSTKWMQQIALDNRINGPPIVVLYFVLCYCFFPIISSHLPMLAAGSYFLGMEGC